VDRQRADVRARARALEEEAGEALESCLLEARREIESAIQRLESVYASDQNEADRREARRSARDTAERGLRDAKARRPAGRREPDHGVGVDASLIGSAVRWDASGRSGVLAEIRGERGVVEVDGVRLTVPVGELSPLHSAERRAPVRRPTAAPERRPDFDVRTEIDLRGLRVDEVEGVLLPVLDAAVVAELPWLRIVHGKGTGALRQIVHGLLDRDPRIPRYRSGDPREGGSGVTMVDLQ